MCRGGGANCGAIGLLSLEQAGQKAASGPLATQVLCGYFLKEMVLVWRGKLAGSQFRETNRVWNETMSPAV